MQSSRKLSVSIILSLQLRKKMANPITTLPSDIDWDEFNNSLTNETLPDDQSNESVFRKLTFVITTAGLLGNLTFLFVVARHKSMHNKTNVYLVNLAVADVIFLVLGSYGHLTDIFSYLTLNLLSCLFIILVTMPYFSSLALVSLVTLDRYYAICHPLKHRAMAGKTRCTKLVAAAWCFSIIYSCVLNVESVMEGHDCQVLKGSRKPCSVTFFKPLPLILLLFCNCFMYVRMIKTLRKNSHFRNICHMQTVPIGMKSRRQSSIRLTRMLAVNTLLFFACNTPRTVLVMVNFFQTTLGKKPFEHQRGVTTISTALLLLNSCINPIYLLADQPDVQTGIL